MIYEYSCPDCASKAEVTKPISEYNTEEICACGTVMNKLLSAGYFKGEKVENSFFSNSLGLVVSGESQEQKIAKDRGLIEVGNENPHKHIKPAKQADYLEGL